MAITEHPCHEHPLRRCEWNNEALYHCQTCQMCGKEMKPMEVKYACQGCDFYSCEPCARLKSETHHPLHAQHPLSVHWSPHGNEFVCSFCGETKESRTFYRCDQCDFRLDMTCATSFGYKDYLLDRYEFIHFLHTEDDHPLAPYKFSGKVVKCDGCGLGVGETPIFQCNLCDFSLHVQCSQVPKLVHHTSHPPHPLSLENSQSDPKSLSCTACLSAIDVGFYLHCSDCPFDLHLLCYFLKHDAKHDLHSEHPLAYFGWISSDNVRCAACNTICNRDLFRCFQCNFNIHANCSSLPVTIDFYDHVHPLTLTPFFEEAEGHYFCSICEKERDPDYGVYLCKEEECHFVAHFECTFSTEKDAEAEAEATYASQKLRDDDSDKSHSEIIKEEDMPLTPDELDSEHYRIVLQLEEEITKLRGVSHQLIIKKRLRRKLTQHLDEIDELQSNVDGLIRQLRESFNEL